MITIYKKEMRTYFTNMVGYIFLAALLFLTGMWFTFDNVQMQHTNFHNVLGSVTIFFFILIPTLTMRLFSEEIRQKTDQLLFTSPLSVAGIVLGKFFAAFSLFLIGTIITIALPLMLHNYGELPVSLIVGSYIGFILLGAACIAIGVFISVLTENQIIAALATMGAILLMFFMNEIARVTPTSIFTSFIFALAVIGIVTAIWYNSTKNIIASVTVGFIGIIIAAVIYIVNGLLYDGLIVRVLMWFSVFVRFNNFFRGIVFLADIVYYISFIALFVYLTINVIEKRRWR